MHVLGGECEYQLQIALHGLVLADGISWPCWVYGVPQFIVRIAARPLSWAITVRQLVYLYHLDV